MGVWVVGAVYALLGALTVAELAAMQPRSGGLYPLVYNVGGGYAGFVAGWTDWLAMCVATGAVAMVFGEYAGPLIPRLSGRAPLVASAVVIAFVLVQWRGIRVGDLVQQFTSLVKTLALLALAALSFALAGSLEPSVPPRPPCPAVWS